MPTPRPGPRGADADAASFVTTVRTAVDARLALFLEEASARAGSAGPEPAAIVSVASELVRRGGKRLRPALIAAAAFACGGDPWAPAIVEAGCAYELFQAYLLIHDDWMDGDEIRRGGPTAHVQLADRHRDRHLGAAAAVLAGDFASALAHRILVSVAADPAIVRTAIEAFAKVHEEVVLGQSIDLVLAAHDRDAVERMHALKTASYTTRGPVDLGAILAGAGDELRAALDAFASPLGIAFQLRDDLLGVFGDSAVTGKPVFADLRARKRTALVAETFRRVEGAARARLEQLFAGGIPNEDDVAWAVSLVEGSGARAAIEDRAETLLRDAQVALARAPITEPGRALLAQLSHALVERRA
jgi:geranylgeranyl diphosphate synthase type I